MRKFQSITIITLSFLITPSCSNLPLHQSKKDIHAEFAKSKLRYYSSKLMYDVCHDNENIHVHISTADYSTQVKILKLGFTLWIDQKGKKNKVKGIVFPQKRTSASNRFKREIGTSRARKDFNLLNKEEGKKKQLHEQFNLSTKMMTMIGMHEENSRNDINTQLEKSDIQVSIIFDTLKNMHYLAIIPINKIFTEEKYMDDIFSIGFESGFVEMSSPPGESQNGSGGRSGGGGMRGGGRSGGGSRGGRTGSPPRQRSALSEPIKTWFKVSIQPLAEQ